jgi:hypothetical protein
MRFDAFVGERPPHKAGLGRGKLLLDMHASVGLLRYVICAAQGSYAQRGIRNFRHLGRMLRWERDAKREVLEITGCDSNCWIGRGVGIEPTT